MTEVAAVGRRSRQRVLLFAPYAAILEHSRIEVFIGASLAGGDFEVDVVRCHRNLPSPCSVLDARPRFVESAGARAQADACRECVHFSSRFDESGDFSSLVLGDFLTVDDYERVAEIRDKARPDNWRDIRVDGIDVGRHAAYVGLLRAKASSTGDLVKVWPRYLADLEGSLRVLFATTRILSANSYDLAVVFGGLYGAERVFQRVARAAGIPTVIIDSSPLAPEFHSTALAFPTDAKYWHAAYSPARTAKMAIPITRSAFERSRRHQQMLITASSHIVYSTSRQAGTTPADVRHMFGIPADAQVLTVLTSSPDEGVATESTDHSEPPADQGFMAQQMEMVRLAVQLAERHKNIHVLLRIHPRLYQDHRSSAESPALEFFESLAGTACSNVHVNHPSQGVSLYDLALITDAGMTQQSTAGLEMLALGIPVIASNRRLREYPIDLLYAAEDGTFEAFEAVALAALHDEASIERIRDVYRWWGVLSDYNRIEATPTVDATNRPSTSSAPSGKRKALSRWKGFALRWTPFWVLRRVDRLRRQRRLEMTIEEILTHAMSDSHVASDTRMAVLAASQGEWFEAARTPLSVAEEEALLFERVVELDSELQPGADSSSKFFRLVVRCTDQGSATGL